MESNEILEGLLSFLTVANKMNRTICQREYAEEVFSLSSTQMQAMIALRYYGTLNMTELSNHLLVTKPQLTKIIDALVKRGLVLRRSDPGNRRVVLVEVTEKGHEYLNETLLGKDSFLVSCIKSVTEEEVEAFKEAVERICDIGRKMKSETTTAEKQVAIK